MTMTMTTVMMMMTMMMMMMMIENIVGSRWVLRVKRDKNGSVNRVKARLVAQGYSLEKVLDYDEMFSPVARNTSM